MLPKRKIIYIYINKHLWCLLSILIVLTVDSYERDRHDISDEEKKAYLAANKCVLTSPQKLNRIPGAKTRWDELVALHQIHALQIHTTGQFLPYHRYYLKTHEFLLRECGYEGAIP